MMMKPLLIVILCSISILGAQTTNTYYDYERNTDIALLSSGAVLFGLGQYRYFQMEAPSEADLDESKLMSWDRPFAGTYSEKAAYWSDVLSWYAAVPVVLSTLDYKNSHISGREFGLTWVMLAEAIMIESGLNLFTRSFQFWSRPFMYGEHGSPEQRSSGQTSGSFYSGHTSAAFTIAAFTSTVYTHRHGRSIQSMLLSAVSYSVASAIGVLRIRAGKHFPSDVAVGALVGTLVGWGVPTLHKKSDAVVAASPGSPAGFMIHIPF